MLLCRASFLVARVHEAASCALGAEVGIEDGRAVFIGTESVGEAGVGAEFGLATMELAGVAEDDARAAVHGADDAANLDVHVAIFLQRADVFAILPEADDGEMAGGVGSLRRADVEEPGAVGKPDHVIDTGGDADVFVEHLRGLVGGDAGFGLAGEGYCWDRESEKQTESLPLRRAEVHE
jgi:hypothetical protein